jgi:hypothetical protein
MKTWLAVLMALLPAASLVAHHSIAGFDTATPVRVKGTVVKVHQINPHSYIFLEETRADGRNRRWAVEGPALFQITRQGLAKELPRPGDVIEVCGYLPKEPVVWQIAETDPSATSTSGRLLNGEMLVTRDGHAQSWGDYGVHKCFGPAHRDQHSNRP